MVDDSPNEPLAGTSEGLEAKGQIQNVSSTDETLRDEPALHDDNDGWQELMGKDLLLKVLEGSPDDGEACQAQDAVVVDIIGRLAENKNSEDGPIFHQVSDLLIVIGEKDVLPALEMGIRFLQVGQAGIIWSHAKFAYGPATRKHLEYELPPDSNVSYYVTLKSIVSPDVHDTAQFQLGLGKKRKLLGNDMYENEWSNGMGQQRSLQMYQKVANDMERLIESTNDEDIQNQAEALMIDCLNNVTAVHMRSKSYHAAKEAAVKVLTLDPENFKALIRAARAAMDDPAGSFEEAEAAISAAEKVNADDVTVKKLRTDLRRRKQQYKQKSKELFSNFWKNDTPETIAAEKKDTSEPEGGQEWEASSLDTLSHAETEKDETALAKWLRILSPYAFQILLPFVIYMLVMWSSKSRDKEGVPVNQS